MAVRWKLKEYLDENGITAYRLAQMVHGDLSQTGVYRLLADELGGVRFDTLSAVIGGLKALTGKEVTPNDLLEVQDRPSPSDDETRAWLDADLAPTLEPYEWGGSDPETLGKPIRYESGKGLIVEGGKDAR